MFAISTSFAQQASFVSPPKTPKTQGEIFREKTSKEAEKAKEKSAEERTVGDYLTIGIDTINKVVDNAPVIYASSPQKLNYLA